MHSPPGTARPLSSESHTKALRCTGIGQAFSRNASPLRTTHWQRPRPYPAFPLPRRRGGPVSSMEPEAVHMDSRLSLRHGSAASESCSGSSSGTVLGPSFPWCSEMAVLCLPRAGCPSARAQSPPGIVLLVAPRLACYKPEVQVTVRGEWLGSPACECGLPALWGLCILLYRPQYY